MRGRKPTPPEQKLSAYGLSPDAADIPKAPGEPDMPPGFDAEHAAEWDAVIADLRAAHTLSREIGATVEVYVRNLVRMRSAEASVAELGAIVNAPKTGVPMQNPTSRSPTGRPRKCAARRPSSGSRLRPAGASAR